MAGIRSGFSSQLHTNNGHNTSIDCVFHTTHGSLRESLISVGWWFWTFSSQFPLSSDDLPRNIWISRCSGTIILLLLFHIGWTSSLFNVSIWCCLVRGIHAYHLKKKLSIWGTWTIRFSGGFWYTIVGNHTNMLLFNPNDTMVQGEQVTRYAIK